MKDISHFKFNNDDKSIILEALNKYRNKGIEYQSDISCVDDLLLKLDNTNVYNGSKTINISHRLQPCLIIV